MNVASTSYTYPPRRPESVHITVEHNDKTQNTENSQPSNCIKDDTIDKCLKAALLINGIGSLFSGFLATESITIEDGKVDAPIFTNPRIDTDTSFLMFLSSLILAVAISIPLNICIACIADKMDTPR